MVVAVQRRNFLKRILALVTSAIATLLGVGSPREGRAAEWPRDAYAARTVDDALRNLYGTSRTQSSRAIRLNVSSYVQNGAVVPISVSCDLLDVHAISILVDDNPWPLAAHVNLIGGTPFFYVNVKMATTSNVRAIVNAGAKLYSVSRKVRVKVGG